MCIAYINGVSFAYLKVIRVFFANIKGYLCGYLSMLLRFLIITCLLASALMPNQSIAESYEVERRLLRIDATESTDLKAARNNQNWQTVQDFGVHGYDKGIYWLHLSIRSNLAESQALIVRNLYALHDVVDFYLFDQNPLQEPKNDSLNAIKHWSMGDTLKNPGWLFADKNFAIPIDLSAKAEQHVLIRIEGINSKMLKTEVIPLSDMLESIHWSRLIFGAIYGIMLAMALYNLIIGIFVRDSAYILYACQVTFFCFFIMSINGDGRYYLWSDYAEFNKYAIQAFGVLYVFFIILFPWYLLKLGKYLPKAKYLFYFLGTIELFFAACVLFLPYDTSMRIAVAISALFSPILLLTGLYLVYRRVPVAGIYTFAWSFYLVGATIVGLAAANIIEMNIFTLNGGAVGGIIEQVLLSIALAKRIHNDRQEKYTALENASHSQLEANRQKKYFKMLFDRAPIGIVTLNALGRITSINPKGCHLLDFDNQEQALELKESFNNQFSTRDQITEKVINTGKIIDHETTIITHKGNTKHCSITLIKQKAAGVSTFEGYITDISERKHMQSILQAVEEERMASLEELVIGVAHEINTPLGNNLTTISFSKDELNKLNELFLTDNLNKTKMEEYIQESGVAFDLMENSLNKISTLINRFKQVSFKHIKPEKQNIKINDYIHSIFEDMLNDYPHVSFELNIQAEEHVHIFPDLFNIILTQLIENSLTHGFGSKGKDIGKEETKGKIDLNLLIEQQSITMQYRDNGKGVEQKLKDTIFNPFVTSNRGNTEHSGLGLYRIYNLVTQVLKGRLQLLDEPGFGITIEFKL
jgi:signal transduction histidine kinase